MADQAISSVIVAANIMKFVQDSAVSASAKFMPPDKFDPNASDADAWFQVYVPSIAQKIGRLGIGAEWVGTVRCDVFSRNQDSQLHVLKLASDVQTAICQEHFVTLDNTDVDLPAVGLCSIYEPNIQCRGSDGRYQTAVLTANFKVTRTA